MSVDILGTSWDQCRSMVQYSFTSTETRRLVRTDSPGRPPRLPHSSWNMHTRSLTRRTFIHEVCCGPILLSLFQSNTDAVFFFFFFFSSLPGRGECLWYNYISPVSVWHTETPGEHWRNTGCSRIRAERPDTRAGPGSWSQCTEKLTSSWAISHWDEQQASQRTCSSVNLFSKMLSL